MTNLLRSTFDASFFSAVVAIGRAASVTAGLLLSCDFARAQGIPWLSPIQVPAAGSQPPGVTSSGDVDGDGRADMFITGEYGPSPFVHTTLVSGQALTTAQSFPQGTAVRFIGDINNDGLGEYLTSEYHNLPTPLEVDVRDGATGTVITSITNLPGGWWSEGTACVLGVTDVDQDGINDIVLGVEQRQDITVLRGPYLGVSHNWMLQDAPEPTAYIYGIDLVGDVNGDGVRDIALVHHGFGWLPWYWSWLGVYSGATGALIYFAQMPPHFGDGLSGIGDIDSDGVDDIYIGGHDLANGRFVSGVDGSLLGPATGGALILDGESWDGWTVANDHRQLPRRFADFDGDGRDEALVHCSVFKSTSNGGIFRSYLAVLDAETMLPAQAIAEETTNPTVVFDYDYTDWLAARSCSTLCSQLEIGVLRTPFVGVDASPGGILPVRGAVIELRVPGNINWHPVTPSHACRTDRDGHYGFADLAAPGSYNVRAVLDYIDPVTGAQRRATAYPLDDPNAVFSIGGYFSSVPPIIFQPPVLLQAGLWDDSSGMAAYQQYLEEDPGGTSQLAQEKAAAKLPSFLCVTMPSASEGSASVPGYQNKARSTQEHTDNGRRLIELSRQFKLRLAGYFSSSDLTRLPFSIVGHSMGGVIARAFATDPQRPPIHRLVNLDSPHGGSWLADWAYWGLGVAPAVSHKQMSGLSSAAGQPPSVPGWNASHIIADGAIPTLLYTCDTSCEWPVNVVNPDESAFGVGESARRGLFGVPLGSGWSQDFVASSADVTAFNVHSDLSGLPLICDNLKRDPDRLREVATFLATGETPPAVVSLAAPPAGQTPTGRLAVEVSAGPGQNGSSFAEFDANTVVRGLAVVSGSGASFEIKHQGQVLQRVNSVNTSFSAEVLQEAFELISPPVGVIEIELTASGSASAELSVTFELSNSAAADVEVSSAMVAPGAPMAITAKLLDSVGMLLVGTSGVAQAILHDPNTGSVSVDLFDDGLHQDGGPDDGVFGTTTAAPSAAGRYEVSARVTSTINGARIDRTAQAMFAVAPAGASFASPLSVLFPDTNSDGLLDALVVSADVLVQTPGRYRLVGNLNASGGARVATFSGEIDPSAGPGVVPLSATVDGPVIVRKGLDGPWTIQDATLVAIDQDSLSVDTESPLVTPPLLAASFEPPPPPAITRVTPDFGPATLPTPVVMSGRGLGEASAVKIDGVNVPFTPRGSDSVELTMPRANRQIRLPVQPTPVGQPPASPLPTRFARIEVVTPWGTAVAVASFRYE